MRYGFEVVMDPATVERVRDRTDIVELVRETVKLTAAGRTYKGLCPFHREKTPSFHVSAERGRYHCFGCGEDGDAFRFVQLTEGLTFVEAVRRLADRAGITVVETDHDPRSREAADGRRRQQAYYAVNAAAAAYFERMLAEHPLGALAREELERRALVPAHATDPVADALQAFRIGYAPYGWDGLCRHLRDAGLDLAAAEAVGLVVRRKSGSGHYDQFRHRLTFAVIDLQGRVVAFSCRSLPEPDPAALARLGLEAPASGAPTPKYVNSPESPIYKKRETVFGLFQARQHVRRAEHAVVVEGNFDVLGLHARGIQHAVAPLGTAFTEEQAAQLRRFAPTVVFLFDGDRAGREAVVKSREPCQRAGLHAKVAVLPEGTDPDELARREGPAAVERCLAAARGMLEHLIATELDDLPPPSDAAARLARVQAVADLIATERDPAVRALADAYADEVVGRLGISEAKSFRALTRRLQSAARRAPAPNSRPDAPAAPLGARARAAGGLEQEILGAVLDYPELLGRGGVVTGLEALTGDVAAAVAVLRRTWEAHGTDGGAEEPGRVLERVIPKLPPSLRAFATARVAAPRLERLEEAEVELAENLARLHTLALARERAVVVAELQRANATGDLEQSLETLRRRQAALEPLAAELQRRARGRGRK
ncbi:MAG TPA: DNA primase [Polyangiaceae bacterium]|nr:DNA primase [Polyangiaceae bacterium]